MKPNSEEFLAIILLINSPKNPLHGDQVLRNSQEFPEKYSGEILRNFVGENSKEFFRNLSKPSLKTVIPQKPLFLGISHELVTGNDYREISWKNLERKSLRLENRGNSSLLLLGYLMLLLSEQFY